MSPPNGSSPLPTSHDTLGASSLNTPHFLASSPPKVSSPHELPNEQSKGRIPRHSRTVNATRQKKSLSSRLHASAPSSDSSDAESNLSDYTFDIDKLRDHVPWVDSTTDGRLQHDNATAKKEDASSEVDGPEDFTLNMVDLIRGKTSGAQKDEEDPKQVNEKNDEPGHTVIPDEYSEFEPPLDMSTPAQMLTRRKSANDDSQMLKSVDRACFLREGSSKISPVAEEPASEEDDNIHIEVERLRRELQRKDEIIQSNQDRIRDAASVSQQVRHLQSELQNYSTLSKERESLERGNVAQQERIEQLETELDSKNAKLEENRTDFESLQAKVEKLHDAANARQEQQEGEEGEERQADTSSLRLQIEEKNKVLDQTSNKFQEAMRAHEKKLQDKIAEIERLKSQQDEQYLELDKLDSDLDSVMRERDGLLQRTEDLDKTVEELEEQIGSLNFELSEIKAERESSSKPLKALASEYSVDAEGQHLPEIIGSLKSILEASRKAHSPKTPGPSDKTQSKGREDELGGLHVKLQESTSSTRIVTLQLESTKKELSESKDLQSTLQKEISQLKSGQSKLQEEVDKVTQERDEATRALQGLRSQKETYQQPSPPSSPQNELPVGKSQQAPDSVHLSHQRELKNLESAHAAAISAIRDSHDEMIRNLHSMLNAAQQRETHLQAELLALKKTSSSQESELAVLRPQKEKLDSVIEAKDAAAASMDTKFAAVLKKREELWEARVERLLGDRDRMGKVLMWTWGEKEVGSGEKRKGARSQKEGKGVIDDVSKSERRQGYRYKYAQKGVNGT